MKKVFQPEDELENNIKLIKQRVRKKQIPKRNAPKIDKDMLIVLSGCSFKAHKQDNNTLILKADEKTNFDNDVNVIRTISYIKGRYEHVSVQGWDWRVDRFKKTKLYLTPYAPTLDL